MEDCYDLARFIRDHRQRSQKPLIAISTGSNGRLSRFTAPITRVTHPSLPFAASSDLPTVFELNQAKHLLGQLPKKKFHIFGHNISHSLSPTLHNAGFRELGLPHHYSIHQTESVDATVAALINCEGFGGASVTFPHKLQVGKLLDSLSPVASKVGAVNTVVVRTLENGERTLLGDNTDWLGIKRLIDSTSLHHLPTSAALVLGAGGAARAACYAIEDLGIKDLIIVNRTRSKAEDMASSFPNCKTHVFDTLEAASLNTPSSIRVIVACVPADDLLKDKIPPALFGADTGVLVEMAYRPQVTGMMKVAGLHPGWNIFRGIDVLEEQAFAQFELWTETPAPTLAMGAAMRAKASGTL
jgi:shikimate-5-dehydrogenase